MARKKFEDKHKSKKYGGYIRLSEEDGNNESVSVGNQRKIISQFADENNLELVEFYIDDGFKGYKMSRPDFDRMKEDLEDGVIDGIIVKDLSRFGRNSAKTQILLEEFAMKEKEIISINDRYSNLSDEDSIVGITMWFNEKYVKDISRKIKSVIHSKQKEGKWIVNVPYGYKRNYARKNAFEIDELTCGYVKQAFELYVNGHGDQAIAKMFNDAKVPTPSQRDAVIREEAGFEPSKKIPAKFWSATVVGRMIENEFYAGTLIQRKCKTLGLNGKTVMRDEEEHIRFENHHEPLIDKDTFVLAKKIREERATKHQHKGVRKYNNIFAGMIVCAQCGKLMTARSGVTDKRYYLCSTYNTLGSDYCSQNRVYEVELIEFIKIYLRQCRNNLVDAINNLDKIIEEELKKVYSASSIQTLDTLKKEYEKSTQELMGLMEQKVKDIISNPAMKDIIESTYQKAINDKSTYLQTLKTQIDEQESASMSSKEAKDGLSKALRIFDDIIASDTLTVKQLKLLVEKIVVQSGGGIEVYMNGSLNEIMKSHVDISLSTVDIYKKAIIDKAFEMKEFFFQDLHREVAKMGYKESYYKKFMPLIKQMVGAGVMVRTPRDSYKNYVQGTIENAYMLFNLYTDTHIGGCTRVTDVSFVGLLQICRWARRAA